SGFIEYGTLLGNLLTLDFAPVGDGFLGQWIDPAAMALRAFLDGIDRAQELAAFFTLSLEHLRPGIGGNALQQPAENFLRAIIPALGIEPGVAPAHRAVTADIVDRARRRFTIAAAAGMRGAERGERGAQHHRHHETPCLARSRG